MTDWIADGEAGSAVRAKLNALSGIPVGVPVVVAAPQATLDIAIPNDGYEYEIRFGEVGFSAGDYLAFAVSADGGTTFINDTSNFDSYAWRELLASYLTDGSDFPFALSEKQSDATFPISTLFGSTAERSYGSLRIWPGSASNFAAFMSDTFTWQQTTDAGKMWNTKEGGGPNPLATATPTKQRINLIRFVAGGNGDVNPPTSGTNLTSGTFALYRRM